MTKRKLTNLSVATSVALAAVPTQIFAVGSILDSAMINVTKPGIYEEVDSSGNVISTDFYSGGVSYSFDSSFPPPLFSVSPPSIEAGCNGINIKGMFISLLGLDQLGAMLQNAGASLAWGVAIGLIYSLPGVASAFKMINQWAKDLQKILGNACQSGIVLGRALADKGLGMQGVRETVENKMQEIIPECQQKGEICLVEALGLGDYFDKNGVFTFGGEIDEMQDKDKKDSISALFRGIFEADMSLGGKVISNVMRLDTSGAMLRAMSNQPSGKAYVSKKIVLVPGLSTPAAGSPYDTIGIDTIAGYMPSESEKTRTKIKLFSYVLLYNFAGDIVTANTDAAIESALGKFTADPSKEQAALQDFENIKKFSPQVFLGGMGSAVSAESAGKIFARFIIEGNSNGSNTNKLKAPVFHTISMEEKESSNVAHVTLLATPSNTNTGDFPIDDYEGTKKGSHCTVMKLVEGSAWTSASCGNTQTVPVLFEDIDFFVNTIHNSPVGDKYRLIEALENYNMVMASYAMINAMQESLNDLGGFNKSFTVTSGTGTTESTTKGETPEFMKAAAAAQLAYVKKVSDMIYSARQEISEYAGTFDNLKEVRGIFEAQDLKNRTRGMKSTI